MKRKERWDKGQKRRHSEVKRPRSVLNVTKGWRLGEDCFRDRTINADKDGSDSVMEASEARDSLT